MVLHPLACSHDLLLVGLDFELTLSVKLINGQHESIWIEHYLFELWLRVLDARLGMEPEGLSQSSRKLLELQLVHRELQAVCWCEFVVVRQAAIIGVEYAILWVDRALGVEVVCVFLDDGSTL